jgi:hypothetical protein
VLVEKFTSIAGDANTQAAGVSFDQTTQGNRAQFRKAKALVDAAGDLGAGRTVEGAYIIEEGPGILVEKFTTAHPLTFGAKSLSGKFGLGCCRV